MGAKLSVNVDHVATLRQARGVAYPDPVAAAALAEAAGASGITVHLRSDRRHIQDADVAALRRSVAGKLNLEMAVTEEMLSIALATRPDQVTLVPERPDELTTEGGLDLAAAGERAAEAARRLTAAGIAVSVFLDPDPRQIDLLAELAPRAAVGGPTGRGGLIRGFEINTDRYTRASGAGREAELAKIAHVARLGGERGFAVYAGHGLTTENVGPVAALPQVEELNIGHAIVSRAVLVGMEAAVGEMLAAIG